jgi:hypothetical protein
MANAQHLRNAHAIQDGAGHFAVLLCVVSRCRMSVGGMGPAKPQAAAPVYQTGGVNSAQCRYVLEKQIVKRSVQGMARA